MHKILQNHLLCAFVANLKIDALYGLYPESFAAKIVLSGKFSLFVTLLVVLNHPCKFQDFALTGIDAHFGQN